LARGRFEGGWGADIKELTLSLSCHFLSLPQLFLPLRILRMISQQLNFFSPLNFNLSYLQIGGLALLLVISSPFLLFAWQYLDFLLFSPLRTLPRASSKNANRDIRASEPVVNELKWLEENDSSKFVLKKTEGKRLQL